MRTFLKLLPLSLLLLVPFAYSVTGTTLNVSGNVVLEYGGLTVPWPSGLYGNCFVSSSSTDCLGTAGSGAGLLGALVIGGIIVAFMLIAVMVARRRRW